MKRYQILLFFLITFISCTSQKEQILWFGKGEGVLLREGAWYSIVADQFVVSIETCDEAIGPYDIIKINKLQDKHRHYYEIEYYKTEMKTRPQSICDVDSVFLHSKYAGKLEFAIYADLAPRLIYNCN